MLRKFIDWLYRRFHRAVRLRFTFSIGEKMQPKDVVLSHINPPSFRIPSPSKSAISTDDVTFNISSVTTVSVIGSPIDSDGNPSLASLSLTNYASSDPNVFTVTPDPATPNGAVMTFVGAGTATLTETVTATEPDGTTTEQIQGVATIVLTVIATGVAASIVFSFGIPQ